MLETRSIHSSISIHRTIITLVKTKPLHRIDTEKHNRKVPQLADIQLELIKAI